LSQSFVFETERLLVREYDVEKDPGNFFALNGDKEVMQYIRAVKSREECDEFLKEIIAAYKTDKGRGRWAVEDKTSGEFVGSFAFIPVTGTPDYQLGYALLKQHWGKGYATELMKEGLRYIFQKTDLEKVFGITESAHVVSQRVLLKTGFLLFQNYMEGGKKMSKFILKRP
jgi:ribosomal-protein-alanine N-acetyltransferase